MTTALSPDGDTLTCFTAALAGALVVRGESRWWRALLAGGPTLSVCPVDTVLLFEHHAVPPVPALGLAVNGADDWETAYAAIEEQVAEHGCVVVLADAFRLPWQRGYQRRHAPHWLTVVNGADGWIVEDPLTMVTELGAQHGHRVPVPSRADLQAWSIGLPSDNIVWRLREEAMVGSADIRPGRTYRWLEVQPGAAPPPPREGRLLGADAVLGLASRFQSAAVAADFRQIDDLWQALRQRELLLWAADRDPDLLDAGGREHWTHATAHWRTLPPLLAHARMRAESGTRVNTSPIVETLLTIADYEGGSLC